MRKLLILCATLALAACNSAPGETVTCSYDLAKNEKTCSITAEERRTFESMTGDPKSLTRVTASNGKTYQQQPDGTLVEEK